MNQQYGPPVKRSLWQRVVPAKVRQNVVLLVFAIAFIGVAIGYLGSMQMRPIVFSQETAASASSITFDIPGTVDFFNNAVAHSIDLSIGNAQYQAMIDDFQQGCEKSWVEADAIIDGTLIESVGIRLKGNSTLGALRFQNESSNCRGPGGFAGPGAPGGPPGFSGPGGPGGPDGPAGFGGPGGGGRVVFRAQRGGGPEGFGGPGGPEGFGGPGGGGPEGFGGPGGGASFDDPSTLPLLLSFDEFVVGRAYQGRTQLAIRPTMGNASNLNEALALQLIEESGQISQDYSWVTYSVNGSPTKTRLVIENPDQNYAVRLNRGAGALYKSKSTNSFSYKGEDPTLYLNDFSQLSAIGSQDLSPVIHLLRWLDQADDDEFDRELAQWIDVEAFARYVATHELLNNFDDMAGPGRNFLLWYDLSDKRFTVITWDMNLAISGFGGGGPRGGFGGPGGGGPFGPPGGGAFAGPPGGAGPGQFQPPAGFRLSEEIAEFVVREGGGGFGRMGSQLKSRFMESDAFADVIQSARDELNSIWFENGRAASLAQELSTNVPVSDSLNSDQIAAETKALKTTVTRD